MSDLLSRLQQSLSRLSPKVLVPVVIVAVLAVGGVVLLLPGEHAPADSKTQLSATGLDIAPTAEQPQALEATPPPEEATAEAAPPGPEVRQDCAAIRGSDYRSDEERVWFMQNCGPGGSSSAVAGAGPATSIGVQSPIGDRLVIPAAGINADIWRAAVPSSGAMPDPSGYFNAVWYDFSRLPGMGGYVTGGNLVLAGHVDCAHCYSGGGSGTAVFWSIRNLKVGDTAQYRTADGNVVSYVVTQSHSVSPTANWDDIVAAGAADMTLITCTGSFSGGEYNLRYIVALRKA